jgi:hypothetical protein
VGAARAAHGAGYRGGGAGRVGTRLAFPTSPRAVRIPAGTAKALGEADVASSERARVVADERAGAAADATIRLTSTGGDEPDAHLATLTLAPSTRVARVDDVPGTAPTGGAGARRPDGLGGRPDRRFPALSRRRAAAAGRAARSGPATGVARRRTPARASDERAVATGERGTGGGGWHRRSGPHAWHATFHGRSMRRRSTLDQPER